MPTQTPAARSAAAEANEDLPLISDAEIEAALSEIETDGAKSALEKLRSADGSAVAVEDAAPSVPAPSSDSIPESPPPADAGSSGAEPADSAPAAAPGVAPQSPAPEHGAQAEPGAAPPVDALPPSPPQPADADQPGSPSPAAAEDSASAPPSDARAETAAAKPDAATGDTANEPAAPPPTPVTADAPAAEPAASPEPAGKAGGAPAAPGGRKVQFKIGSKAAPAEPAAAANPADAPASPSSPDAAPARTPATDVASQHRASAWKRVGRALDCMLDVFDWPVRRLGASGRRVVGASALSLLLLACGALALRTMIPHPDAVAFLRQKRAELSQPPKPKAEAGGAHSAGATKGASTGHGGGH